VDINVVPTDDQTSTADVVRPENNIYIYIHIYTGNGTGQPANSVLHPVLRFSSGKAGTSSELMQTVMLNVLPHTQLTITLCTQCDD